MNCVARSTTSAVIARHSRSKNGVASLAYDRTIQYAVPPRSIANADGYWMPAFAGMTTGNWGSHS